MIKVPEKLNMLLDVHVPSPTDDDVLYWDDTAGLWKSKADAFITDHGALTGLGDDDHSQYHTDARGDTRYLYKENVAAFTPDGNYEPATKKYVDDSVAGAGEPTTWAANQNWYRPIKFASSAAWMLDDIRSWWFYLEDGEDIYVDIESGAMKVA